ncbi:MAG TPA: aconitase family protein, partial [Blastocatellia bacterium]|nr:aconitase family protein [Blastocatellia bacterium]
MPDKHQDSFGTRAELRVGSNAFTYYSLDSLSRKGLDPSRLPFSLKIMLENLLRNEDGLTVTRDDIETLARGGAGKSEKEIAFRPARVLMQDFTGVPAVVDLATMRDWMKQSGGDPERINPLQQVDLVVDHSVQVDGFGNVQAFALNAGLEMERNRERYFFLK